MKILQDKYPLGSLPHQQTAGRYFDETLYLNLEILAKKIFDDMTFLTIMSSSTLEVGTGKSTFAQQIAEAWTYLVNKQGKLNLDFTCRNIVFKPRDLIERAFKVPKYSCIILDEWEDAHYWSELGMSLRQFFRKCRQLNLFMIIICPNFFQVPRPYAISRSVSFIDVKFEGEFERGYFAFYNFERKKDLYIKGKKNEDYKVVRPNFSGRFSKGYSVDENEYRAMKLKDMEDAEDNNFKKITEKDIKVKLFKQLYENLGNVTVERLSNAFGVSKRTGSRWLNEENTKEIVENEVEKDIGDNYINNLNQDDDDCNNLSQ